MDVDPVGTPEAASPKLRETKKKGKPGWDLDYFNVQFCLNFSVK